MPRPEPQPLFEPQLEGIDARGLAERGADLRQRAVERRAAGSSRGKRRGTYPLAVTVCTRPMRHLAGPQACVTAGYVFFSVTNVKVLVTNKETSRRCQGPAWTCGVKPWREIRRPARLEQLQAAEDLADDLEFRERHFFGRVIGIVGNDFDARRPRRAQQLQALDHDALKRIADGIEAVGGRGLVAGIDYHAVARHDCRRHAVAACIEDQKPG